MRAPSSRDAEAGPPTADGPPCLHRRSFPRARSPSSAAAYAGTCPADDEAPKRIISLSATGAIKTDARPGRHLDRRHQPGADRAEALAKNSAAMANVVEALKAEGIDAKDIQTTDFSVQPLYEERKEGQPPAIVGYQVTNSVRLTLHDTASSAPSSTRW